MDKFMSLKPRSTEKVYGQSKDLNTYVFDVPTTANKHGVATAVQAQYDVTVTKVAISILKGKKKRTFVSRRGKYVSGTRSDVKKAYVTLKKGDKLPIFADVEEAEAKEQKAADKAAKKAIKEKK